MEYFTLFFLQNSFLVSDLKVTASKEKKGHNHQAKPSKQRKKPPQMLLSFILNNNPASAPHRHHSPQYLVVQLRQFLQEILRKHL